MKVGMIVPQGWTGEYDGWDAARAWSRSLEIAQEAERLGAESLWVYDHVHTTPEPTDELTFESFTVLAALASVTRQVRLGHTVVCAGYRNPALLAKIASTLDVISGGRFDLGLGAGWKEEEYLAYGWAFPSLKERQELLRDTLEIVRRMTDPDGGRASYEGAHASIHDAINLPKPVGPGGLPIMVGGNGPRVTWGLAARYATDLVAISVGMRARLPAVRALIASLREALPGTLVLVGGAALAGDPELWRALDADLYHPNTVAAVDLASARMNDEPRPTNDGRRTTNDE